jgi:hypothetical protein
VPEGFFAAMGEVAQVPTQWSGDIAAEALLGLQKRVSRQSRRYRDLLGCVVMAVLIAISSTSILPLFRGKAG